jgi:AhpD family alkylhydroperoxidase
MLKQLRSRAIGGIFTVAALSLALGLHLATPSATVEAAPPSGDVSYQELIAKVGKYGAELEKGNPEGMASFHAFARAVSKTGALDAKSKKLIALGIAVAVHCDACIAVHTRGSLEAGATKDQVVEALGVAVLMGGGPAYAYATHAVEAMEQLEATGE